jgi:thioredoxin-like negative regulator of GroEL
MKKILFFSASWCGPCKNFKPVMEQVSRELPVEFIDIDANPQLVAEYGVRNVPTIVVVNNGQVSSKQAGVLTESQVKNLWNQA